MLHCLIERDAFTARDGCTRLIDQRLRPCQFGFRLARLELGNGRTQRRFERRKAAGCNLSSEPRVISWRECDRHYSMLAQSAAAVCPGDRATRDGILLRLDHPRLRLLRGFARRGRGAPSFPPSGALSGNPAANASAESSVGFPLPLNAPRE